jgi:polyhydroxybutyrate depolymerase
LLHRTIIFALTSAIPALSIVSCGDDELTAMQHDADVEVLDTAAPDTTAPDTAAADTAAPDTAVDDGDATEDAAADDALPVLQLPDAGSDAADAVTEPPSLDPLGGDRPALVYLPDGYDAATPTPLVILLHGYSATGPVQDLYLGFHERATEAGLIAMVPNGTADAFGVHFWNADPAWCCNFANSGVDDEGYLLGLIAEAGERFNVDPARVYLLGHSNGGFMAYRMACAHADVVAGVVSIAGALPKAIGDCAPDRPVTVVEVHGTLDAVISYYGNLAYPSAEATIDRWVGYDGCDPVPVASGGFDYDSGVLGAETQKLVWDGCDDGALVSRWTLNGSSHVPLFTSAFLPDAFAFLLSHTRR